MTPKKEDPMSNEKVDIEQESVVTGSSAWKKANILQQNIKTILDSAEINEEIRKNTNVKMDPTQNIVTIANSDKTKSFDIQYNPATNTVSSVTIHSIDPTSDSEAESHRFFEEADIAQALAAIPAALSGSVSQLPPPVVSDDISTSTTDTSVAQAAFVLPTDEIETVEEALRKVGLNNTTGIGPRPTSSADNAEWNKINRDAGYIYDPKTGDLSLKKLEKALQLKPEYKKLTSPQRQLYIDELVRRLTTKATPRNVLPNVIPDVSLNLGGIDRAETASTSLGSMPGGLDGKDDSATSLTGVPDIRGLGSRVYTDAPPEIERFEKVTAIVSSILQKYSDADSTLGRTKLKNIKVGNSVLKNAIIEEIGLKNLPKDAKKKEELINSLAMEYIKRRKALEASE
jgi:hypothetical protein